MSVSSNPIATGWLNENSLREYPFHEGCGLRPNDSAGSLVENGWSIPNCLLVDMSVAVEGSDMDPFLYLGQMSVVDGSVTLVFCGRDGSRAMTAYATRSEHVRNQSYQISGSGAYSHARAVICLGDLDSFFGLTPDGAYSFSPEETRIEPTCIRPSSSGVRTIRAVDASGYTSQPLSGVVNIVAGDNIRFDYDSGSNALIVSAVSDSGYSGGCDCSESNAHAMVRSVNGMAVDEVEIVGDDCIQVSSDNGVIRMSDSCAKPCCGCAEATFINQTINNLQTSVSTLAGNVAALGDRLTSFVTSYVLSRKTLA